MYGESEELFGKALAEALSRKYDGELSQCHETAQCSDEHLKEMKAIVRSGGGASKPKRSGKKKWVIALLVAAVLLLAGCSAYVYRDEIRDFIEEIYDKHIKITYDRGEQPSSGVEITENYTLTYLPEGYFSVSEFYSSTGNVCIWQNSEGGYIIFEQRPLNRTSHVVDGESGATSMIKHNDYDLYYRTTEDHSYIWNDGKYALKISASMPLSEEEVIAIIEGIETVE